ncbi:zinc transporter ZIP1-like [Mytilus edulis]|uniref:zinc transporter ZIP1-like n=1 Tax=Mytilus edulis TaxID=6550 RepID=UPI0039EF8484
MELTTLKVVIIFGLFIATLLLGFFPIKLVAHIKKRNASRIRYRRAISILSCYAAGVFLGTCLLDLLPSVRRDLETILRKMHLLSGFPVSEFVMVFGLFLILVVEQIILSWKENQQNSSFLTTGKDNSRKSLLSDTDDRDFMSSTRSDLSEHSIGGISDEPYGQKQLSTCSNVHVSGDVYNDTEQEPFYSKEKHEKGNENEFEHNHSTLRSILLLIALSLHSVFEGLAVGLQRKSAQVIGVFAGLFLHKMVLSFSLGMSLVQSKLSYKSMLQSVTIFSLSSPFGIGLGLLIIDLWDSRISVLIQGLLQGIACGTFLYVTFFEILPHELNSSDIRLIKVVFLILGFSTVTAVVFINEKS